MKRRKCFKKNMKENKTCKKNCRRKATAPSLSWSDRETDDVPHFFKLLMNRPSEEECILQTATDSNHFRNMPKNLSSTSASTFTEQYEGFYILYWWHLSQIWGVFVVMIMLWLWPGWEMPEGREETETPWCYTCFTFPFSQVLMKGLSEIKPILNIQISHTMPLQAMLSQSLL